jgi:hypothetical protein
MNATCTMHAYAAWLHIAAILPCLLHGDGPLADAAGLPAGFAAVIELIRSLAWLI